MILTTLVSRISFIVSEMCCCPWHGGLGHPSLQSPHYENYSDTEMSVCYIIHVSYNSKGFVCGQLLCLLYCQLFNNLTGLDVFPARKNWTLEYRTEMFNIMLLFWNRNVLNTSLDVDVSILWEKQILSFGSRHSVNKALPLHLSFWRALPMR